MITLTAPNHSITHQTADTVSGTPSASLSKKFKLILKYALTAYEVSIERRQMLKLSDSQLLDIGVTRQQIIAESKRSWRDIPQR